MAEQKTTKTAYRLDPKNLETNNRKLVAENETEATFEVKVTKASKHVGTATVTALLTVDRWKEEPDGEQDLLLSGNVKKLVDASNIVRADHLEPEEAQAKAKDKIAKLAAAAGMSIDEFKKLL